MTTEQVESLKSQGNSAFSAGEFEKAIELFTQAINLDSSNHVLFSNRSAAYSSLKKFELALKDAESTTSLKSNWAKGYSRKGAAYFGLDKLEEALAAYRQGLEYEPDNAMLKKGIDDVEAAMASSNAGPFGKIFGPDVFAKMASNPKLSPYLSDQSVVSKIQMLQKNPQLVNGMMGDPKMMQVMMGLLGIDGSAADKFQVDEEPAPLPKREEPKKQEKKVEPEVVLSPEEQDAKDKRTASDKEKDLGNALYKQRKFEDALVHYDTAFSLDGSNVPVLTNKSAVLFEMEKYQECIQVCQQAADLGRDIFADFKVIARAYSRMGNAYFKLGDFDNSIKFLEKSLSEHRVPDVLQKLREVEKAKKEFSEQSYYSIEESDIAREKGNELFKAHDYIGAVKFYSDAIKRNKNDPKNFSNRAACYLKLMALPEADRDCDAAISIDKNFVKAYIRKAAILHAKREFMKSIDVCNEAKAIDVEHKHTDELDNQIQKCYYGLNQVQNSEDKAETLKRAENDPEVIKIMQDPVMQQILQQMQADPKAARDHMRNPIIAEKLKVLINAGILRTG